MIVVCFQESDSQFRYIALELCIGTLTDYIEKKVTCSTSAIDLLSQAMSGLSHLHSLGIGKLQYDGIFCLCTSTCLHVYMNVCLNNLLR